MAILEAKSLSFSYPKSENNALTDLSFSVERGQFVLLMGKSGSGKSTLLHLLKPEIAPYGTLQGNCNSSAEQIGFVFQNPDDSIVTDTVVSELAFSLENRGADSAEITRKISECAAFFHINHLLDKKTSTLSGGEKQLLSLAAAMMTAPEVLLLDEPCAQLDPASAEKFTEVLLRLNRELGTTVLMSTHNPGELLAAADQALLLDAGRLVLFAPPQAFVQQLKASKHEMCAALPPQTRLLDASPLTVRDAIPLAGVLLEKPMEQQSANEVVLRLKNVCFAYEKKKKDIFFRLHYQVERGKINAVVGTNGAGKSTLLKVMAGVLKPYSGKVQTKLHVAMLPQTVQYLFTKDFVRDEVSMESAEKLGITALLDRHPLDLSGGESRLLGLGVLLDTGADVLLLDEPTAGLDAILKIQLAKQLQQLCKSGKTVVLVTHDLEFAGRYADNVAFLCNRVLSKPEARRVFFSGMDLYTTPVRRMTRSYLQRAVSEDDLL